MQPETPPHSIEAEQAVIGGVLSTGQAEKVSDLLRAEDFYRLEHRLTWQAIGALADAGQSVDIVTVTERLAAHGELEDAGGRGLVAQWAMDSTGGANLRSYAQIIADRARRREVLAAAGQMMEQAYAAESASDAVEAAQSAVMNIGGDSGGSGPVAIRDAMKGWMAEMEARSESDGGVTGLPTGYTDLDRRTTGLHSGNLAVVAGRPGMGKTAFAMGMLAAAGRAGKPAIVFSMEMSREELVERAVAATARVDLHSIRSAKLDDSDWSAIADATGTLTSWPLWIDDTPALRISQIRSRARRQKQRHGLSLVVVDYMSLAKGEGENRNNQIGDVSQGLKALAKELSVPVVALAQLNRGVESRANKRPTLHDLRESGQIEQDADLVVFLYRDEVYHEDTPDKGIAEVIISKHRNGETGRFPMVFRAETAQYLDAAPGTTLNQGGTAAAYRGAEAFDEF